jgi:UDP-glucose 4-epimerase
MDRKLKENKTVLITGVAGLIGSRFASWLLQNTDSVVVGIDDLSGGYASNVDSRVIFHKMNLVTDETESLFEKYNIDLIYHFAAYAAEGLSPFIRKYNYENNLIATTRLINMAIKYDVGRFVFTSTLAVYGHGEFNVFDESQLPAPIDPYGIAKYACEMDLKVAADQHGLDYVIIRPHNVYGINQNIWDKYRNVLGIWMYQTLEGDKMTIFGDGNQTRAFSFVDDSMKPLWNAGINDSACGEIINLGGIRETSINEAAQTLIEVMGKGSVIHLESRHEVKHSVPTWQKSVDLLNFEHKTELKEGLEIMWEWAKNQPRRQRFVWPSYELEKGIYAFWKS